jgi:hypothetical protein
MQLKVIAAVFAAVLGVAVAIPAPAADVVVRGDCGPNPHSNC